MKFFLPFLFLTLLSVKSSFAQTHREIKAAEKKFAGMFYGSVQPGGFSKTIRFQNMSGLMFVKVMIHGRPYNFLFDCGAIMLVSKSLLKELNLKPTGSNPVTDAYNVKQEQATYKIDELKLDDVSFNNMGCIAADLSTLSDLTCVHIDGVFGVNAMRTCYWRINMQDSSIYFSNKLPPIPQKAEVLHFEEAMGGNIYLKMQYADTSVYAEFDCGSNRLLSIPDSLFMKGSDFKNHHYVVIQGTLGYSLYNKNMGKSYRTVNSIWLDGKKFDNTVIESEPHTQLLIGTPFIKDRETILNWKHHKIYFSEMPEKDTLGDGKHSMGIGFDIINGKLTVNYLWEGSSADKAGIKIGDQITAINGQETTDINRDIFCNLRKAVYAHQMSITVKKPSGEEKQAILTNDLLIK